MNSNGFHERQFMAQRVQIILEDDIDGGPADETLTFGLDGVTYEIDLNEKNASALRDALAPYTGHARRAGGRRSTARKAATPGGNTSAVREWARANGHTVSDRGRISADVMAAYEKANR